METLNNNTDAALFRCCAAIADFAEDPTQANESDVVVSIDQLQSLPLSRNQLRQLVKQLIYSSAYTQSVSAGMYLDHICNAVLDKWSVQPS